jgi:hypothetical protein
MILLPLWRGVNPEHPLVDMGVSFGCVFSAIRIALLTTAATTATTTQSTKQRQYQMITTATAAAARKKLDDVTIVDDDSDTTADSTSTVSTRIMATTQCNNNLQSASLGDYIRHMYLEEPTPASHLTMEEIEKSNGRSVASAVDSIQAQLIQLTNRYDNWLKSIGWHTLPFWIRYPIAPLVYLLMMQLPLAMVARNIDFITFYSVDATAAAYFFHMSTVTAFLHWTAVILSLAFALYLSMLMWYTIVFDLVQWSVGASIRRDLFCRPWLTSSPRDLWGRRWNLPVQASLVEAAYRPCCQLLDAITTKVYQSVPKKEVDAKSGVVLLPRPLRRINRFIAGFGVFLFSAIIHEYTLSVTFGRSDFDHLRFFTFHGLLIIGYTLLETVARALLPSAFMPNGSLPFVFGWFITWLCMAMSSQWFFMPYIRGGLIESLVCYAFL